MKRILLALFFLLLAFTGYANGINDISKEDTMEVKALNKRALDARLIDPAQGIVLANKALALAKKINYDEGVAEAYRMRGISQYYSNMLLESIKSYSDALDAYKKCKDERGVARVYNNMGNLYRDNDYDKSIEFFNSAMEIAERLKDPGLIATVNLSYGNFYYRKNSFTKALGYYDKSLTLFTSLKDSVNIIQCLQNKGVIYFNLRQMELAQQYLLQAVKEAKERDLNETVASIDLTLALVYVSSNKFAEAEKIIAEGLAFSQILKDDALIHDFKYTNYQLELKRKNYQGAVKYLSEVYSKDSLEKKTQVSAQIMLFEERKKREDQEKENELTEKENQYERVRFWGVTSVAGLLLVVVGLLVSNVKSKAKTNVQLTELNAEVSRQKDNLDRVNHHLEEIIDERTKDLQIKNRKLSDYSSYLSHQIRGPIATLKGLMNLEKEGLVDNQECINMMGKCVSEIDEKIIEMSDMMHDTKVNQ